MKHIITGGFGDVGSMLYKLYKAEDLDICHFEEERNMDADRILHLAAKSPPATVEQIINSNIIYLRELVNYAMRNKVKELIFFSAISVYGDRNKEDINEQDLIYQPDIYGASKLLGEEILKNSPLKVISVRLPAILGYRNITNILSRCYLKLQKNERIELKNINRLFNNFISIESIFEFIADLKFIKEYDVINLASKKEMTILEIMTLMKDVMKSRSEIVINNEEHTFLNISTDKAESEYGFRPQGSRDVITEWARQRQEYEGHKVS